MVEVPVYGKYGPLQIEYMLVGANPESLFHGNFKFECCALFKVDDILLKFRMRYAEAADKLERMFNVGLF